MLRRCGHPTDNEAGCYDCIEERHAEEVKKAVLAERERIAKKFDELADKDPNEWIPPIQAARMIRGA